MGVFFLGRFEGPGPVYVHAIVDGFSSYAFAILSTITRIGPAIEALQDQALPFFSEHRIAVRSVLSGRLSETDREAMDAYSRGRRIEHRPRDGSLGFIERFRRTAINEFLRRPFVRRLSRAGLPRLQRELDDWLASYNEERPHEGYPNYGATPAERHHAGVQARLRPPCGMAPKSATPCETYRGSQVLPGDYCRVLVDVWIFLRASRTICRQQRLSLDIGSSVEGTLMSRIPDQLAQLSERLTRAEALLARQRERVHQWREAGLDVGKSVALLEVWEQTVEQFRISRRILQSFGLRLRPGGLTPQGRLERRNSSPPLQPLRRTEPAAFRCPHCALTLRLKGDRNGTLVYDVADWHRRCSHKSP